MSILQVIFNDCEWKKTSEIYESLYKDGIRLSKCSNSLINKHLNMFLRFGLLEKRNSILTRNKKGQFIKSECKWKLKRNLTKEEIINFPYGVLK